MFILICILVFIFVCYWDSWFDYKKASDDYRDCCHEEMIGILQDTYKLEQKHYTEEEEAQKRLEQIYKSNAEIVLKRTRTVAEKDGVRIAQEIVDYK